MNFNEIVFIGNSITEGGKNWSEKFNIPNIRNRGIGGDVTDGVLERLGEIIFFKPKAVFILIGINDLCKPLHMLSLLPIPAACIQTLYTIYVQI